MSINVESKIKELRLQGKGYKLIAKEMSISRDTVRYYSDKLGLNGVKGEEPKPKEYTCKYCNKKYYKNDSDIKSLAYCSSYCKSKQTEENKIKRDLTKTKECVVCGKKFISKSSVNITCSKECRCERQLELREQRKRVCINCGKEYSAMSYSSKKYCSMACSTQATSKSHRQFCNELLEIHNGTIVPLEIYTGSDHKLKCMCLKCGCTIEKVSHLYIGSHSFGCPNCGRGGSKGEQAIRNILESIGCSYKPQYSLRDKENKRTFRYDFALIDEQGNAIKLIEFDGIQHFKSIKQFGGDKSYNKRIEVDEYKNSVAKNKNIPLLRIRYDEIDQVDTIVKEFVCPPPRKIV